MTDASGAVLPGVTVTVTQTDTGLVRTVVTDENGSYLLSNLPTGPYRLEVSLQGFRTYVQTGIVLQVGATPTINAVLALGTLEETVTVEARRAARRRPQRRHQRRRRERADRRAAAAGTPGHRPDRARRRGGPDRRASAAAASPGGVNISVAGGLPFGVGYTLDGAMHNNPQKNANLPLPFPDALQEFRVATSGLSAQNGMHSGASVNAVTKSGTNRFSGNAFEFLRDHRFNATSPFAAIGPDGKRAGRRPEAQPVRRHARRSDRQGQAVLLRRLPGHRCCVSARRRTSRSCRRRRCWPATSRRSPRPRATAAGRSTLRAPFVNNRINPGAVQPGGAEPREAAADDDRSVRPDHVRRQGRPATSSQPLGADRLPAEREALDLRPLHGRRSFTQPSGYAGGSDNVLKTDDPGANDMAHSLTVGDTMVFSSSIVNSRAVRGQQGDGRQLPDAVLLAAATSARTSTATDPGDMVVDVSPAASGCIRREPATALFRQRHVPGGRRPDAGARRPSARRRRQRAVLEGPLHVDVARRRQLDLQRHGDRPRAGGFPGRPRDQRSSTAARQRLPVDNWYLGLYAQDTWRVIEPRDGQLRPALGAVLRPERRERRDLRSSTWTTSRRAIKSKVFLNAPAGLIYPGDAGFPNGTDRVEQAVVEPVAARRRRVGRARRRPPRGALVVRDGLRLHGGRVPQHQRRRAAVRQPLAHHGSDGPVRRSVQRRRRRSAPDRHQREHRRTCRSARSARWIPTSTRRACSRGT